LAADLEKEWQSLKVMIDFGEKSLFNQNGAKRNMHVMSAKDPAEKGVVVGCCGSGSEMSYFVNERADRTGEERRWGEETFQPKWSGDEFFPKLKDIVIDEASEENQKHLEDLQREFEEQMKKLKELEAKILSDFDSALSEPWNDNIHAALTKLVKEFSAQDHVYNFEKMNQDMFDRTPALHLAARDNRTQTVKALLMAGLPAGATCGSGRTALWRACENRSDGEGGWDAKNGGKAGKRWGEREAAAAELMEATKVAGVLDQQDHGEGRDKRRSALHWASMNGMGSTVSKLLSLGADASLKDQGNEDPFQLYLLPFVEQSRAFNPDTDIDKILAHESESKDITVRAAFAEHYSQMGITDENKNELLLRCAHLGVASRLPAVLQAGADPAHTDTNGKTGLWLACEIKDEATAAVLMEETKRAGALNLQVTKEACLGVWWGAGG